MRTPSTRPARAGSICQASRRDPGAGASTAVSLLLVRDLAQVATPAGDATPIRGAALRAVEIVVDAYVLVRDGTIEAGIGRMRDLQPLREEVDELDGRGLSAIPASSTATRTRPSPATVPTSSRCVRGATYEELLREAAGPVDDPRDPRGGEAARRDRRPASRAPCSRAGRRVQGEERYGLDRERSSRSWRLRAADGVPTWLGAHAVPPGIRMPMRTSTAAIEHVLPDVAESPSPRTSSSSAGRSTWTRRAATSWRAERPGSCFGSTATSSLRWGGAAGDRGRRRRSTTSRRPVPRGLRRSRRARWSAFSCRLRAPTWDGRCPRWRARTTPVRRSHARRLQPGQRVLREPAGGLQRSPAPSWGSDTGGGARSPAR